MPPLPPPPPELHPVVSAVVVTHEDVPDELTDWTPSVYDVQELKPLKV